VRRIGTASIAALAMAVAGCTSGTHGTTGIAASEVVGATTQPYPEGPPGPHVKTADALWPKVRHALPAVLPNPLNQPDGCATGNVTSLTLASGKTLDYGPCRRPASIDAIRCILAGSGAGCQ
jgi:hypothetical protein